MVWRAFTGGGWARNNNTNCAGYFSQTCFVTSGSWVKTPCASIFLYRSKIVSFGA